VLCVLFRARAEDFCNFWSKKYHIFSAVNFFNLWVIRIGSGSVFSLKMLDPGPESMNPDPKHWFPSLDLDPNLSSKRVSDLDWIRIQFSQAGQSGSQTDKKKLRNF
jgi:hypothetical protein